MIISVASGKGGTGKTTVATNLALSIDNVQFIDCDVEEPNAHIFLKPEIEKKLSVSIPIPKVDESKCNYCGKCSEICAFNAIAVLKEKVLVFSGLCHGCGGCSLLCPEKAIAETGNKIGVTKIGKTDSILFVDGKLDIGEPMSPPLIREVKKHINTDKTVIIDVPPGTSCPVIEAVKGSDFCILVTEPTPFGLYDLKLAVELMEKMEILFGVVINQSDIGDERVEQYCLNLNIPILMKIPFDKDIAFEYSKGIPIVLKKIEKKQNFKNLYYQVKELVK